MGAGWLCWQEGCLHAAHEQWAGGLVLPPPARAAGMLPPAPRAVGMPGILKGHSPAMHMWGFSLSLSFFFDRLWNGLYTQQFSLLELNSSRDRRVMVVSEDSEDRGL